jgi:hypothetical protein
MDSFVSFLKDDLTTSRWLQQLLDTVMGNVNVNVGGTNLNMSTGIKSR